jgi:hypothetical protein
LITRGRKDLEMLKKKSHPFGPDNTIMQEYKLPYCEEKTIYVTYGP